jgi:uncharacterized protein (TIGR01777 family)
LRVAISGASGLIGSALHKDLAADGAQVIRLVRRPAIAADEVSWMPAGDGPAVAPAALAGLDAVIHLAGAPIADRRWTAARKAELRASRVQPTSRLAAALAATNPPPRALLCGSAIGYYGNTGDRAVDESAPQGAGFLAELVRDWEAAAAPAARAGIRVVSLRSGIVLAAGGGMLKRLGPLFRLGLGARVGSGRQFFSWISLTDEIRAIMRIIEDQELAGAINLTAPNPVTNSEFTKALAAALGRPALLAAPEFALRAALGEVADELLASARVTPGRLTAAGFTFRHPDIASALSDLR